MGRSRGGLTTKIHALVDAMGRPIRLKMTEGQAHDGRSAADMFDTVEAGTILLADSAYDSDELRDKLTARLGEISGQCRTVSDTRRSALGSTDSATPSRGSSTSSNTSAPSQPDTTNGRQLSCSRTAPTTAMNCATSLPHAALGEISGQCRTVSDTRRSALGSTDSANAVERFFNKLKHSIVPVPKQRAVGRQPDTTKSHYGYKNHVTFVDRRPSDGRWRMHDQPGCGTIGGVGSRSSVQLASMRIWLRTYESVT